MKLSFARVLKPRSIQNGRLCEQNVKPTAGARVAQDSRSEGVCITSQIYAVTANNLCYCCGTETMGSPKMFHHDCPRSLIFRSLAVCVT